jgi:membrane protein required for colicin V production
MNLVDILIWVVLLIFAVKGFMKGLVMEVCSLAGVVVGGWAALVYCHPFAEVLRQHSKLPSALTSILSFGLIFLSLGLLFFFLGHLLTTLFKIVLLGGLNRIGGVLMGLLQGALVVSVLLSFAGSKLVPMKVSSRLASSATARPFLFCGEKIMSWWSTDTDPSSPRKPVRTPSTTADMPGQAAHGFRERL